MTLKKSCTSSLTTFVSKYTHTQVESQVAVYIYRGNFPSQFEKKEGAFGQNC